MFLVENVIRSAWRRAVEGPLNVLIISDNNEKYVSLVCQTANNFYLWTTEGLSWNNETERKPENLQIINADWPTSYFDMIICNDRLDQYSLAASLSHRFHLPILLVDHCSKDAIKPLHIFDGVGDSSPEILHRNPTAIISTSDHINLSWPSGKLRLVIPPGIDTAKFCPPDSRQPDAAFGEGLTDKRIIFDNATAPEVGRSIFGALTGRDYTVIPTDSDIEEKERIYQQGDYFINTQNYVTVKMLEAMACGNIPICFAKPDLVQFIENGVDGFVVNDSGQVKEVIDSLDELTEKERSNISNNAREKVISTQTTTQGFVSKWESIFNYMKSQYYIAEV